MRGLNFLAFGCLFAFMGAPSAVATSDFDIIVPYFAGKDEICSNSNHEPRLGSVYKVTVKKIISLKSVTEIVDGQMYSGEDYCTVVVEQDSLSGTRIGRYSVSQSRCQRLIDAKFFQGQIRVVEDHFCELMY